MCRGAACRASSNWACVGALLAAPSLGRASPSTWLRTGPAPAVLFVIRHSEMRIPQLSEIVSVTSFPRNGTTLSVCIGASSPGAQSRISPLPSVGERARVRAGGKRCGVSHVSVPADRTPASAVPTCSDK
jgi:hypothetical protein